MDRTGNNEPAGPRRENNINNARATIRATISGGYLTRQGICRSFPEAEPAATENRFNLEALEPRILLSADPVSGGFARLIEQDNADDADVYEAALTQQIEQAELSIYQADDEVSNSDIAFEWPEA